MTIPWGPIIGSVVGGGIDAWATNQTNKANAKNVQAQIDFQREQNATAYQRAVDDMRKAGLNPGLAYQQGGAGSGSGAAAQNQPLTQNSVAKFATALQLYNDMANSQAQRDLIREQASKTAVETSMASANLQMLQPDLVTRTSGAYQNEYFKERMADLWEKQLQHANYPERFKADIASIGAGTALSQAAAAEARTRSTLNEQDFQHVWVRKNLSPFLNDAKKVTGLFSGVNNLRR